MERAIFFSDTSEISLSLSFKGLVRVKYEIHLLSPDERGVILNSWVGTNIEPPRTKPGKDLISIVSSANDLNFTPITWRYDLFPSGDLVGQIYNIEMNFIQNERVLKTISYEDQLSSFKILGDNRYFIQII